eukprot:scaffold34421_cov151-Isochrysis_galbana.AAC.1
MALFRRGQSGQPVQRIRIRAGTCSPRRKRANEQCVCEEDGQNKGRHTAPAFTRAFFFGPAAARVSTAVRR